MSDPITGSSSSPLAVSIPADVSASSVNPPEAPSPEDRTQSSLDEGLIETFPASDPPARGAIGHRPETSGATSPSRTVRLIERLEVARDTLAFRFEKPAGFEFRAGQHVRLVLPGPATRPVAETSRRFSLASAPTEPFLMIATRMRGTPFKDALAACPIGAELGIEGPLGGLTLHDDPTVPAVLLARGIGITPFRSILQESASLHHSHRFFLFYSNRQAPDAPFLGELEALERQHANITLIVTMTQPGELWSGETGHLDPDLIARYLKNVSPPVYYLSGPGRMVHGLESALITRGVRRDRLRMEVFEGY
jgi:ferredoxin-NADP reductase